MKHLIFFLIAIQLFSCSRNSDLNNPTTQDQLNINNENTIAIDLNSYLKPLPKLPSQANDQDLSDFKALKGIKIIGLGEATHGTKEFFQMKERLFQYFVNNLDHKVFAFEMDYGESLLLDEYVQNGKGSQEVLTELMKNEMHFWTWKTEEVRNLIQYMSARNYARPEKERLHLYGIDCQYFDTNARVLLSKITAIQPSLLNDVEGILTEMSKPNYIPSLMDINKVYGLIKSNKEIITSKSTVQDYETMEHLAEIMVQTYDVLKGNNSNARDEYMAKNTIWLSERTGFPMSVWAHNYHIQKADDAFGSRQMGFFINNSLQGNYKTIGFSFSGGSATAYNTETKKVQTNVISDIVKSEFSNSVFSKTKYENYFYKTSDIFGNTAIRKYLKSTPFFQIGALYSNEIVPNLAQYPPFTENNFDFMIHINTSSPSVPL